MEQQQEDNPIIVLIALACAIGFGLVVYNLVGGCMDAVGEGLSNFRKETGK